MMHGQTKIKFFIIIIINSFASCLRIYPGHRRVEVERVYV